MNIKSVTLTNVGRKGLSVEYTQPSERKGSPTKKPEIKKENLPYPIHLGLEVPFKDLRYHLLSLCDIISSDMDKNDKDSLISQCEVVKIIVDGNSFVIKGTKENRAGKLFELKTPKEEEADSYEDYEAVVAIIGKILEETKLYLKGDVVVTMEEMTLRFIGSMKQEDKDKDGYDDMDETQKRQYLADKLEKIYGCVVLMPEDVEINSSDEEESMIIDPQAEVITLPAKKK